MLRKTIYAAVVALSTLAVWPQDADAQIFRGRNWGVRVGYPSYYYGGGGYYNYPSYYYGYPAYYGGGYYSSPYYYNSYYAPRYYGGYRYWR